MKSKILLPLVAIAAVAAFALYSQKPGVFEEMLPAAISTNDESSTGLEQLVQTEPATAWNTPPELETEIVHGLEVRKDRNCTVELKYIDIGNGNVIEAYACTPNQPPEPGQYDQYDDATLIGMSYADPLAAEVVGKRLAESDPVRARMLLIRSVALRPENTDPILWLASAYYGLVAENGEPALLEMSENYLLQRIAEELGAGGASDSIRLNLVEAGFRDEDFLEIEGAVRVDLNEIRAIQVEVTGSSELTEWQL
jgi:hypothetical protein